MKKILFIGSEALPFVSAGGLGDVLGALPKALLEYKLDVRVVIPLYSSISDEYRSKMKFECSFNVKLAWRNQHCEIYSYDLNGVIYYFVDNEYYFKRQILYGCFDDGERYAYFCRAVLEMLGHIGYVPDVLHANDWHSALAVIYIKRQCSANIKTVFTIHNIEYQGIYDVSILNDIFALNNEDKSVVEYNDNINLVKGAVECCDILTTVSKKYAEEIQYFYHSAGLNPIIARNKDKLYGVVNGIDTSYYNPETDSDIISCYCADDLGGKAICKKELQKICDMKISPDLPVISMVSRLAHHKGFDLIKCVMEEFLKLDVQFVLLGTGDYEMEKYFKEIARRYPEKTGIFIEYDKSFSKKIYSGSDIFLMPSKSEPCGLAQMIAARYGTVPVVHKTGGLYDTIQPFDYSKGTGNGFTFESYNAHDMLNAIKRAISAFEQPRIWKTVMENAMKTDFSWNKSAAEYAEIYDKL